MLGRGDELPAPTSEESEEWEATKSQAVHAMLLEAARYFGVVDPDEPEKIREALATLLWHGSSGMTSEELDRAVETTQALLRLPPEQQDRLLHPQELEIGVVDDADDGGENIESEVVDPGNGNGSPREPPPPPRWARPDTSPAAF